MKIRFGPFKIKSLWNLRIIELFLVIGFLFLYDPYSLKAIHDRYVSFDGIVVRKGLQWSWSSDGSDDRCYVILRTNDGKRVRRFIHVSDFDEVRPKLFVHKKKGFSERLEWQGRYEEREKQEAFLNYMKKELKR